MNLEWKTNTFLEKYGPYIIHWLSLSHIVLSNIDGLCLSACTNSPYTPCQMHVDRNPISFPCIRGLRPAEVIHGQYYLRLMMKDDNFLTFFFDFLFCLHRGTFVEAFKKLDCCMDMISLTFIECQRVIISGSTGVKSQDGLR